MGTFNKNSLFLYTFMNILLINPWIYDFAAYDLWLKPLGLLRIASFLEKFEHKIFLINCLDRNHPLLKEQYEKLPSEQAYDCGKFFSQEVKKPFFLKNAPRKYKRYGIPLKIFEEDLCRVTPPDAIGVTSGMTYWYPGVFEVIKRVKEKFPSVPVILGGIYATLCWEHALKHSKADHVIKGRGEIAILKILDKIKGVKRNYSKIFSSKTTKDLFPAYHLLSHPKSVAILTSRGCPFRCSYCASYLLENCFTQNKPEKVLKKMSYYLKEFGIKDIVFYDDALLANAQKHIIPILEGIIKKFKGKIRFHTPNGLHIKFIDKRIAKLLYAANFTTIRLSFESTDPEIQKNSSNKTSKKDLIKTIKNLTDAGYKKEDLGVYIMVGLPHQKIKEVIKTIEFVHKQGAKVKIAQFSPIPGTLAFAQALKKYSPSLKEEPLLQNNSIFYLWNKEITYEVLSQIKNLAKK